MSAKIKELIGEESYQKIVDIYAGETVYIRKTKYIKDEAIKLWDDGNTIKQIARKLNITNNHVYKLLKKRNKK